MAQLPTILSGVVNAERDYLWSYAAPIFNNFVTIASFFAFSALEESNLGLALVILAVPVCTLAERALGIRDDGRITADEWMLFPLALLGLPLADLPWWSMLVFFSVVRALDILKPWPARRLQALPGGCGIVIDDFVANVFALAVNWLLAAVLF
jgi:phosphatidylglycerophosphatase A